MRKWLKTRGREILALLSDIGGALALVVFAASVIVAAVVGAALLMLDVFPQPFFTLFVLGMASLAAGLTLHFLRPALTTASKQAPVVTPELDSPYSKAAALQRQHDDAKAKEEERTRVLAERRALRWVREELLDNRHRITRAAEGEIEELHQLTDQHWKECEATLLELENPLPHAKARQAYRKIESIEHTQYTRDPGDPSFLILRDFPAELPAGEVQSALEAIDAAHKSLAAEELGVPENQ